MRVSLSPRRSSAHHSGTNRPTIRGAIPVGLALAALATLLAPAPAAAQSVCFPPGGGGVPGQPGLPDWWTGTAAFDDPRWLGSYGFGHGTVKFDAMVETSGGQKFVLMKWHIKPDPGPAGAGDNVIVGFFNPTTTVGTIVKLSRAATTTTAAGTVGAGVLTASTFTRTGTSGLWSSGSLPADVGAKARLDTFCTLADPIICNEWIVRLRVPTSAAGGGVEVGDTFKMWYEVDVEHGGTTDRAKWPVGALTVDDSGDPVVFPEPLGSASPASAAWNDVKIAGPGACAAGIDLQSADISVSNALGAGTQIDVNSANTFHAKPINNTVTVFNPNSIKARLRIADWGSAVGDSPRWITVPDPGCEAATGTGAAGTITGGTRFDLTCSWTLTAGQRCAYRPDLSPGCVPDPGPRYAHQCIMAELLSNGPPVPFSRDSAWNNFSFASASRLQRKARVDIGTLGPRDVYLYVATENMPARVASDAPRDPQRTDLGAVAPAARQRLAAIAPGRVGAKEAAALQSMVAAGQLTYEDVAKVMPTYAVHVWHDTGKTVTTAAGTSKLLQPQPSFTLLVSHDGPLVGWRHALNAPAGATLTELSKDFYRVAVGPENTIELTTVVEALESNPPPPRWWLWLLLALLLFIGFFFRFLKRASPP